MICTPSYYTYGSSVLSHSDVIDLLQNLVSEKIEFESCIYLRDSTHQYKELRFSN